MPQILKITRSTILKRRPLQASALPESEKSAIAPGHLLKLHSYAFADERGDDFDNHIKIALADPSDYIRGLNTWFVYAGHAQVFQGDKLVYPHPPEADIDSAQPLPVGILGTATAQRSIGGVALATPTIALPSGRRIRLGDAIVTGGSFTWAEATHGGTRMPRSIRIEQNMIALATALQPARNQLNVPFQITSWYRPPEVNEAIGGASNSQHLFGKAADIVTIGLSSREAGRQLDWWPGGMGIYAGGWVHLDIGPRRRWRG